MEATKMHSAEVEDDPVVKEIPVYLSKTLADELVVLQYPVYDANINISKAFIKPKNQKIRVEFAMDTTNELSYDRNIGEQLAQNAAEKSTGNDNGNIFDSNLMDKAVLTSELTLSDCSNFAVGVFQDDELHITQLKAMLDMKLQCNYLDESDKDAKDGTGKDDDKKEDDATAVEVTFARHLPDKLKKQQEQSFQHHSKKNQEECWTCMNYHASTDDTEILQLTRMKMFCLSEESVNTLNLIRKDYLQLLVSDESCLQTTSDDQKNLYCIKALSLQKQIKTFMKQVGVVSFAMLCEMLFPDRDERSTREILKHLQEVAMLVQGNWVVKSEEIYEDSLSPQNNISDFMCKVRDCILSLFNNTEQQFLNRNTILSDIKLTPEEINQFFAKLLTYESEKGWRLKEPFDLNFCDSYREIVDRQKILWKAKREHLLKN